MIKIKEYLNFETILLFILSVISGAFATMFFVFYDAPDNAGIVNAIFDFVKLFLHYPLFFASPFVVIILGILIKKLTINRRLIVCLFKIKYSVKKQTILSIFFILFPLILLIFAYAFYTLFSNVMLLFWLMAAAVAMWIYYVAFLVVYFLWRAENCIKMNKLVMINNKYFNNLFIQILPVILPIFIYYLCRVRYDLLLETDFYYLMPVIIFLIFYISLSNAQKLNDLIRYLYRHIVYVLIAFGAGIYYVNRSVVVSITSTNDTPAPMTYVVKFAMIIIALVMIFRLPLYKLHQRSKQLYKEAEEDYTKSYSLYGSCTNTLF